jgi:hypothetical protein
MITDHQVPKMLQAGMGLLKSLNIALLKGSYNRKSPRPAKAVSTARCSAYLVCPYILSNLCHHVFQGSSLSSAVTCPQHAASQVHKTVGIIAASDGILRMSQATKNNGRLLAALDCLIENVWCFDECHAVRLGKGCKNLPKMPNATHSTLLY